MRKYINLLYDNGFTIGIHTNGYTPEILEKIIGKIDYVGMDIKNDFDNYDKNCGKVFPKSNK